MHARFYAPEARAAGDVVPLPDEEARHLRRVLRLRTGDAVRVFNGRGGEFDALVARTEGRGVAVSIVAPRAAAPEPRVAVTLAQAVLKGDKMDDVVRDAVMMGVTAIVPVVSDRSELTLAALSRARRRERWERIAVSSAKQCGRAVVPPIAEPCTFDALQQALAVSAVPGSAMMLIEPGASVAARPLADSIPPAPPATTVLIGPEGGWAPREVEQAGASCRLITLGGRTLRADAMPVVALAALFALWKEL